MSAVVQDDVVAARSPWSAIVRAGQRLTITDLEGNQAVDFLLYNADNVVERKVVTTGVRDGQLRVIESGLSPDDWVVTEGVQRAFPGAKVDPQRGQLASAEPEPATSPEKATSPASDKK